ncbi:MAG: hypothetical protein ACOC0D_04830 [Spirochaeta sp.]
MRQFFLILLITMVLSGTAAGLDIGFTLDSATGVRQGADPDLSISHADTLEFWGMRHRGESPVGFYWRAWYRYSLDRPVAVELEDLYLTARLEGDAAAAAIRAGRFTLRDWGGTVFNHSQDGAGATISLGPVDMRVFAGTTALIAGHRSTIFLSSLDTDNRDEIFGSPRVVSGVGLRLPNILPGFTPVLEGISQFEIRPDSDVAWNSQYITLQMNQIIGGGFSIDMTGSAMFAQSAEAGSTDFLLGYHGRAGLQYVQPQIAGLNLGLRGWYSSANEQNPVQAGSLTVSRYQPISTHNVASALPVAVGGTFGGRLQGSVKPFGTGQPIWLQEFLLSVHGIPVFRSAPTAQPIEEVSLDNEDLYMGTEIGAGAALRPTSDLGMRLGGGIFLPGGALTDNSLRWRAAVELSLSF